MIVSGFTRYDCQLGKRRVSYERLCREYRCNSCGGVLNLKWDEKMPDNWSVACLGCGSHDFIHERALQRQKIDSIEVWNGLPPEVAALLR